jgi:hypothetical protein
METLRLYMIHVQEGWQKMEWLLAALIYCAWEIYYNGNGYRYAVLIILYLLRWYVCIFLSLRPIATVPVFVLLGSRSSQQLAAGAVFKTSSICILELYIIIIY